MCGFCWYVKDVIARSVSVRSWIQSTNNDISQVVYLWIILGADDRPSVCWILDILSASFGGRKPPVAVSRFCRLALYAVCAFSTYKSSQPERELDWLPVLKKARCFVFDLFMHSRIYLAFCLCESPSLGNAADLRISSFPCRRLTDDLQHSHQSGWVLFRKS